MGKFIHKPPVQRRCQTYGHNGRIAVVAVGPDGYARSWAYYCEECMEDMAKGLPGYVKEYDDAKVEVQKTADAARKAKEAAEKAAAEQAAAYHKVVADDLIERKEAEAAALLKEAEELKAKPALEVLGIVKPDAVDSEDVKPETADGNAESETANNGEDVKPDAVDSESVAPETADVATAKKTRGRKAAK